MIVNAASQLLWRRKAKDRRKGKERTEGKERGLRRLCLTGYRSSLVWRFRWFSGELVAEWLDCVSMAVLTRCLGRSFGGSIGD